MQAIKVNQGDTIETKYLDYVGSRDLDMDKTVHIYKIESNLIAVINKTALMVPKNMEEDAHAVTDKQENRPEDVAIDAALLTMRVIKEQEECIPILLEFLDEYQKRKSLKITTFSDN